MTEHGSLLHVNLRGQVGELCVHFDFELPTEGVTVVFGRSGAGKTTLLRAIAGHERFVGLVRWGRRTWQATTPASFVLPEQRRVAFVFQQAALFPHLTVLGNLEFAQRRIPDARRRFQLDQLIDWLELDGLLPRKPEKLSGGEAQRVSIARALASSPELLLMDEPLSSLDLAGKSRIVERLLALSRDAKLPIVYVTHSTAELAQLGSRMLWLERGRVLALGAVADLLTRFDLARSLADDAGAVLKASFAEFDAVHHLSRFDSSWGPIWVPVSGGAEGRPTRLWIRARDVSLSLTPEARTSILNVLPAQVVGFEETSPGETLVRLCNTRDKAEPLLARITTRSREALELESGMMVHVQIKSVSLR